MEHNLRSNVSDRRTPSFGRRSSRERAITAIASVLVSTVLLGSVVIGLTSPGQTTAPVAAAEPSRHS